MSFDLNISSKWSKFDPEFWELHVGYKLPKFKFEATIDWKIHDGFIPCSWENPIDQNSRIESGFEFYLEDRSIVKKSKFFGIKFTKRDWDVMLSFGSEEFELGWIAAVSLAKTSVGIVENPQTGETFEHTKELDGALKKAIENRDASEERGQVIISPTTIDQLTLSNETAKTYFFLEGLYSDDLFPNFLVDKCKIILIELCHKIEISKPKDLEALYVLSNESVEKIGTVLVGGCW